MLGESQDDEVVDNLADGFRREFGCGLSSSSDSESSQEMNISDEDGGKFNRAKFIQEARKEIEERLEKELVDK